MTGIIEAARQADLPIDVLSRLSDSPSTENGGSPECSVSCSARRGNGRAMTGETARKQTSEDDSGLGERSTSLRPKIAGSDVIDRQSREGEVRRVRSVDEAELAARRRNPLLSVDDGRKKKSSPTRTRTVGREKRHRTRVSRRLT